MKLLTLDIETQRAIVESFSLFPDGIGIDHVVRPARILCFAAKWLDQDEVLFHAAWDDDDERAYRDMLDSAFTLLDNADFVVTWNGEKFDLQWFEGEFGRLNMGRPAPYRNLDLIKVARKNFDKSLMSRKLDWSARHWLGDRKVSHGGIDLWHDIRWGTKQEKAHAQQLMMEYNIHDVVLTEQLFERYRPWIGENFALYDSDGVDGTPRCTRCASANLEKRGFFYTTCFSYQRYRCKDCGSWSRGKRRVYTTELRPV